VKLQFLQGRLLGGSTGIGLPSPKTEGRNPKEIRSPKPEITNAFDRRGADRPTVSRSAKLFGFFGFRNSGFLRVSGFGLRISRATHSPVRNLGELRSISSFRGAFTLIEVVISAALMALIVVSAYLCLNAAVSSQKMIEPRATVFQNARVAMALMAADLRCASRSRRIPHSSACTA
jgi:hypothetical protein